MNRTFFVIALFTLIASTLQYSRRRNDFHLNKRDVVIEAFSPSGIRVSLPDCNGMKSVFFNGNINSPIKKNEIGDLSVNVSAPTNGRWTFVDDNVQLRVGDSINFWIDVKLMESSYSVYNDWSFVVREIISKRPEEKRSFNVSDGNTLTLKFPISTSFGSPGNIEYALNINLTTTLNPLASIPTSATNKAAEAELSVVKSQLNSTREYVIQLSERVTSLDKELQILKQMMEIPVIGKNIGTRLFLAGDKPPKANLVETIRQLVVEKLDLPDLDKKILQAYETEDGIMFEVPTAIDKQRILVKASTRLIHSPYKIVDPENNTYSSYNQTQTLAGKSRNL